MANRQQFVFELLLELIKDYGHTDEIVIGECVEGTTCIEDKGNNLYDVYDVVRGGRHGVKTCLSAIVAAQAALKKIAVSRDEYDTMYLELIDRLAKSDDPSPCTKDQ